MNQIVTCYTLFDITYTGILNRNRVPEDQDPQEWMYKRNTQCNFDTILQAISLRSQPEIIKTPIVKKIKLEQVECFGFLFQHDDFINCWEFDFNIQHKSVFSDGYTKFGSLYNDCHNIPMILCGTEYEKLSSFIDCSPELKNIYFEFKNE